MDRFDLVQKAYDELSTEGKLNPVDMPEDVDTQKALVTRRAAYYLNQYDAGFGLLSKTTGNNRMNLSVDCIYNKGLGKLYDIATDEAVGSKLRVKLVNSFGDLFTDSSRWVQPQITWCDFPVVDNPSEPPSTPPDTPPNVPDLDALFDTLADKVISRLSPELTELHARLLTLEQKLDAVDNSVKGIKSCIFRK